MVKKQVIYPVIVIASLLLGAVLLGNSPSKPKLGQVVFPDLNFQLQVEIAETELQRVQGLMLRPLLALDKGMLFIYEQEAIQRVWMKNTLIALDIIFVSDKGVIVSIIQGLKPCLREPCKIYSSNEKARYMLEVNAGLIKKTAITVDQKMIFERL